ncbi:phosphopantetheine-binding protein [Streptomyces sp. CAU 1734]|uniref:acyl carrier protein n=1 Tax=Streptomyces sp. CAU 1734 TaxID=3140360 RepID=UPI003261AAB3
MDHSTIVTAVNEAVIDALGVEPEEVVPEATLLDDLGAESIDLLDILFRLERSLGIKIQAAELAAHVQGGIPDEEFGDENEIVSAAGLAQLKKVMPQIDTAELGGKLRATRVMGLFTVENLAGLVASRAEADATAGIAA